MKTAIAVLALGLIGVAHADVWRWTDHAGRLHYSNIPGRAPGGSAALTGRIGVIEAPVPNADREAEVRSAAAGQMRHESILRRRLDEIQQDKARLDATRRAYYERLYGGSITPPPLGLQASPEWRALDAEETALRHELSARAPQ
jgi:uncharacterized protein DUF4124